MGRPLDAMEERALFATWRNGRQPLYTLAFRLSTLLTVSRHFPTSRELSADSGVGFGHSQTASRLQAYNPFSIPESANRSARSTGSRPPLAPSQVPWPGRWQRVAFLGGPVRNPAVISS